MASRLTKQQKLELKRLAQMKDKDIDLTDIPELLPEQIERMQRGLFYRGGKSSSQAINLCNLDGGELPGRR